MTTQWIHGLLLAMLVGAAAASAVPTHYETLMAGLPSRVRNRYSVAAGLAPMPLRRYGGQFRAGEDVINVMDYGAKGDNVTDNTAAFTAAFAAAVKQLGGIVYAPGGLFRFNSSIEIPSGVELQGSYLSVPSHVTRAQEWPGDGTTLMPTGDRGNDSAPPFIVVQGNAAIRGLVIWHPEQLPDALPVPYPFSIALVGNDAAVTDVEILNSWHGISAVNAPRHYIARVQGQPIDIGIYIDSTYDIGRLEDIHFNPWFSINLDFMYHQTTFGRAFVMGRSDWEYVFNTFAFAYAYGYHFVETPTGTMNGNFLGIGADYACNASVQVDAAQAPGLLITNGEFTSFHDKSFAPNNTAASAQVVVGPDNVGPVQFVTSSFWGPSVNVARLYGNSSTTFSSCVFVAWDYAKAGEPAVKAMNGKLIMQGNTFEQPTKQLELQSGVYKAIVTGNIFAGKENITNNAKQSAVSLNLFD